MVDTALKLVVPAVVDNIIKSNVERSKQLKNFLLVD